MGLAGLGTLSTAAPERKVLGEVYPKLLEGRDEYECRNGFVEVANDGQVVGEFKDAHRKVEEVNAGKDQEEDGYKRFHVKGFDVLNAQ